MTRPPLAWFCVLPLLTLFAAGCGGSMGKEVLGVAETYATAACACKDAACGEGAAAEYGKSMKALSAKNAGKDTRMSDDEQKKIADATNRAVACLAKLGSMPRAQ